MAHCSYHNLCGVQPQGQQSQKVTLSMTTKVFSTLQGLNNIRFFPIHNLKTEF